MRALPFVNRQTAASIAGSFILSLGICSLIVISLGLYYGIFGKAFYFYIPQGILSLFLGFVLIYAVQIKSHLLTNIAIVFSALMISGSAFLMILMIFAELDGLAYIPLVSLIVLHSHILWVIFEWRKVVKISSTSFGDKTTFDIDSEIKPERLQEEKEDEV